jgi:adenylate cyclase
LPQDIEIERRLSAVLAADVAGFSRLTEADEIGTLRLLAAQRAILDNAIARHRGRIANTAVDSVLAESPSAVNAVQCAVEAQQALRDAAEEMPEDRRVLFSHGHSRRRRDGEELRVTQLPWCATRMARKSTNVFCKIPTPCPNK